MAIVKTVQGARVVEPGSYTITKIAPAGAFNIAPGGVVALIGEAEAGAPTVNEDIRESRYTQDQFSQIVEKYRRGPIVDAAFLLFNPSNSARIPNGANELVIYKTNASEQASRTLGMGDGLSYGDITSGNYGLDENTISEQIEDAQDEVGPAFEFNYMPDPTTAAILGARVNGQAAETYTINALTTPAALVAALNGAISNIQFDGGTNRDVLDGLYQGTPGQLALSRDGLSITITLTVKSEWGNAPSVGDTLFIPSGSILVGTGNANRGGYIVTAVSDTEITAWKLTDITVSPKAVSATPIPSSEDSFTCYSSITGTYDTVITVSGGATLTPVKSGNNITFTLSTGTFGDKLRVGQMVTIGDGFNAANQGTYMISAVTNSAPGSFTIENASGVTESAVAVTDENFVMAAITPPGIGAAVEIYDGGGAAAFQDLIYGGEDREVLNSVKITNGSQISLDASAGGGVVQVTCNTAFVGKPIAGDIMTIPPGSVLEGVREISSVVCVADVADSLDGKYFTLSSAYDATSYYVWLNTPAGAGDPAPGGTGIAVTIATGATASAVATAVAAAINSSASADFSAAAVGSTVTITNVNPGPAVAAADVDTTFTITTTQNGLTNVGNYLVTAVTAQTITATKFSGTPGTVGLSDIASTDDVLVFAGWTSTDAVPKVVTSSAERRIRINLNRASDAVSEESSATGGDIVMTIGYDGTTCTMTIDGGYLYTTRTGGSGANLQIDLSKYASIADLIDYINSQTGYTCSTPNPGLAALAPSALDRVTEVGICDQNGTAQSGRIKIDAYQFAQFFSDSTICSFEAGSAGYAGLPPAQTVAEFLSGGVLGATTQASFSEGLDQFERLRINSVVPLFSRDAVEDIQEGLTDPASSYKIASIHAAARAHVIKMSGTKKRGERNAYASIKDTFVASKEAARTLNSYRVSLTLQDALVLDATGNLEWKQPWALAALAAGMQAGAPIGTPMTNKFVQCSGVRHDDFDFVIDKDEALLNGLLMFEEPQGVGGIKITLGNTTYQNDDNFVYNRISVIYAADQIATNLRDRLTEQFVGENVAAVSAGTVKNMIIALMSSFLAAQMIVGDDTNGGLGWKNLVVRIDGNTILITITVTVAQGVDFTISEISLDTIRQSA